MSAYAGSFNGGVFGTSIRPGASVRSLTGFGSTKGTVVVTEATGGGGHVGPVVRGPKQIGLGLNLHASSQAELDALKDEIDYRFDPAAGELPLVIGGRCVFATVVEVNHAPDPSWPGEETSAPCDIVLQAGDPGEFSAAEETMTFGGGGSPVSTVDLPFENLGRALTRSGHAWRLRITAHGTVVSPSIELLETGQKVTWLGLTMTGGQVLTMEADRASRVGSRLVDHYRRSGSSEFPDHPVLQEGTNTFRVTATSGLLSGFVAARSVYRA